jgi:polysaccharide export outer membrane protein
MIALQTRTMGRRLIALICCVSLLSACAGLPLAPAYPLDDPGFSQSTPQTRPGMPGDVAEGLKLYPGDVLTVELASTQTQTLAGLMIDGVGDIHLPLIGDVRVGGLSLADAETAIKTEAQRFDRLVQVNVALSTPSGHRVAVLGAVAVPGVLVLPPGARIADVIALAGGPRMSVGDVGVDWNGSRVVRVGEPLPIDLAKAVAGDPLHNVHLRPGDHVYVAYAHASLVTVLGAVGGARAVPFHDGLRLTEALALAGGIAAEGDKSDVRVIRGPLDAPRVYTTSLRGVVGGESHDVALYPGDVVYVTEHWLGDVGEVVALVAPFLSIGLSAAAFYLSIRTLNQRQAAAAAAAAP